MNLESVFPFWDGFWVERHVSWAGKDFRLKICRERGNDKLERITYCQHQSQSPHHSANLNCEYSVQFLWPSATLAAVENLYTQAAQVVGRSRQDLMQSHLFGILGKFRSASVTTPVTSKPRTSGGWGSVSWRVGLDVGRKGREGGGGFYSIHAWPSVLMPWQMGSRP